MKNIILQVNNLTINAKVGNELVKIVDSMSFKLHIGERLAIVGESGCGKTMTAMSLFGLLPVNCKAQGKAIFKQKVDLINIDNCYLRNLRGKDMVLIPQNGSDYLIPVLKVKHQMYETLRKCGIKKKKDLKLKASSLLTNVGFDDPEGILNKYPFQLSGGMAQKVILSIGLATSPGLVIADEPTRGMDEESIAEYLMQLNLLFKNSGVILITHNIEIAKKCDITLVMYGGEIMEFGKTEKIFNKPIHPYTKSLIKSLPENGLNIKKSVFGTNRYNISSRENGCKYYECCEIAKEKCKICHPKLSIQNGVEKRCYYA